MKKSLSCLLLSVFLTSPLLAQHYNYVNTDPNAGRYVPKSYNKYRQKQDMEYLQMIYYINNSIREVSFEIEKNKKWSGLFEKMKNDSLFDLNIFFTIYPELLGMENDIIADVLKSNGFKPQMRPKKPLLYRVDSLVNDIKSTLKKSPNDYKNFMHLINTFKQITDIRKTILDKCADMNNVMMHKVFFGKYKSDNPKVGDLSKYELSTVDLAMTNKLFTWKSDLINRILENPDKYVKYFGNYIKDPKVLYKNY